MRIAIYARVSKDRQETENQLIQLRQFCSRQGWTIHEEFIDKETGAIASRDRFRDLFAAAARREFDLVLAWALDRFTREGVAETFQHIARLRGHGIEFVSFTEEHFRTTGPAGELMIAIAAWIAKQERIRISERVRAGLDRARLHGTRTGNAIGRPRRVFDRAAVVKLRADGLSWPRIARQLGVGVGTAVRTFKAREAL